MPSAAFRALRGSIQTVVSGPELRHVTKDAHEVEQIEPAGAGLRRRLCGGLPSDRLLPDHRDQTMDFVYVASSKAAGPNSYGEMDIFEINSESGHMRQIPASPFLPAAAIRSLKQFPRLRQVSSSPTRTTTASFNFVIGTDGKLYAYNTVNTPGVFPRDRPAAANLFVVDTYQPLPSCSPASPCSGSIASYPVTGTAHGAIGSPAVNRASARTTGRSIVAGSPKDHRAPPALTALAHRQICLSSRRTILRLPHRLHVRLCGRRRSAQPRQ